MIPQRITDYLRERRIRALSKRLADLVRRRNIAEARMVQEAWLAELHARTPEQVARMERRMTGGCRGRR